DQHAARLPDGMQDEVDAQGCAHEAERPFVGGSSRTRGVPVGSGSPRAGVKYMLGALPNHRNEPRDPTPMTPDASSPDHRPLLSVLLVNYNGKHHLEECLSSIRGQDFADHEVVLVDNASRDGSVAFVRERFPEVRVFDSG